MKNVGLVVVDEAFWQKGLMKDRSIKIASLAADVTDWPVLNATGATDTAWLHDISAKLEAICLALPMDEFLATQHLAGISVEDADRAALLEWERKVETAKLFVPGMSYRDRKAAKAAADVNVTLSRRWAMWCVISNIIDGSGDAGRLQRRKRADKAGEGAEALMILRSRHVVRNAVRDLPVILLDATYPKEIVEYYFPDMRCRTRARAAMPNMFIRQVFGDNKGGLSGGFGKTSLDPSKHRAAAEKKRIAGRIADLVDYVKLYSGGQPAALITYQEFERHFVGIPCLTAAHFNNISGLDAFKDVANLFVVGRPFPQAEDTWRMATALTGERLPMEKPAKTAFGVLMRDGTGTEVQSYGYASGVLAAVHAAISDAEAVQSVGRGRGVNRTASDPLRIHYFGDVVLPFPVDELVALKDVAPDAVDQMWLRGGIAWSPSDAIALYPDLFASTDDAKNAISGGARCTSPIRVYYRGCTPCSSDPVPFLPPLIAVQVLYHAPGKGRKIRRASVPGDRVAEFEERLRGLHGEKLEIVKESSL
jgi:hypothetical protein